eukprot:gene34172-44150_t
MDDEDDSLDTRVDSSSKKKEIKDAVLKDNRSGAIADDSATSEDDMSLE